MSPGQWNELNLARLNDIQIADAMQARITAMVASSIPTKEKKKFTEADFRFFSTKDKERPDQAGLLEKVKMIAATANQFFASK